ncbi:hypothetical protein F2Q69_00051291 [Brassica cretica]|uniref:Leucine-rich repeat-containing N-terminal plant-type domain-containing protein n=1 Tax=Brassica cretica TaxID=69181 RepID=A0A8S9PGZ1_BRACR|nr:hypothetical protein F2Q69_00051291 [Brassica cretica]
MRQPQPVDQKGSDKEPGSKLLTGSLSPAIGNLTRMEWLAVSSNNFSGSIPAEIGSCTKLQQIWMMDLEVTGRIPDFIGNWTKLVSLVINARCAE